MATLDRENTAESRTGDDARQATVTEDGTAQATATEDDSAKQDDEQAPDDAAQDETGQAGARHAGGVSVPDAPVDGNFAGMGVGPEYVLSEDELNLDEDEEDDVAGSGDLNEFAIASGDAPARESGSSSKAGYGFNSGQAFGGQGEAQALAPGFDGPGDLLADTQPTGTGFVAPQQFGEFTVRSAGDRGGVQVASTGG
ncbi:MAG: hypothetical protein ACE5GT_07830, partial [Rhodospirillales bacterium]